MTKKGKGKKEKQGNFETVFVDINDVLDIAKSVIMEKHGGIGYGDVEYVGNVDKLEFTIPKIDRKGKCNETIFFESEKIGKDGGCGETGGACICGLPAGHEDDHECDLCGENW